VEIYLHDGKVLTERRDVAKGWAVNPLSEKEFEGKFQGLAQTPYQEIGSEFSKW
jgi:hypothetical protein